jgi:hypothetical protein
MTDNERELEKQMLKKQLELMEGFTTYLIIDNKFVDNNPNLKQKATKLLQQLTDIKNHIV